MQSVEREEICINIRKIKKSDGEHPIFYFALSYLCLPLLNKANVPTPECVPMTVPT